MQTVSKDGCHIKFTSLGKTEAPFLQVRLNLFITTDFIPDTQNCLRTADTVRNKLTALS